MQLLLILGLVANVLALPQASAPVLDINGEPLQSSADLSARNQCNHDNLLRLFIDQRYSVSASAFCSSYIATTTSVTVTDATVTQTTTTTAFATTTSTTTSTTSKFSTKVYAKRSVPAPDNAITYGASRLSSACSCLITKAGTNTATLKATATAKVTQTKVVTTTASATATATATAGNCRINGYGTAQYNIATGSAADAVSVATCKAFCARTAGCVSFGVGAGQCAAYNQPAIVNARPQTVLTPYYFYDRGCDA